MFRDGRLTETGGEGCQDFGRLPLRSGPGLCHARRRPRPPPPARQSTRRLRVGCCSSAAHVDTANETMWWRRALRSYGRDGVASSGSADGTAAYRYGCRMPRIPTPAGRCHAARCHRVPPALRRGSRRASSLAVWATVLPRTDGPPEALLGLSPSRLCPGM